MTDRDTLVKYLRGAATQARETGQLAVVAWPFLSDLALFGAEIEFPADGRDPCRLSAGQCERYADQIATKGRAASDQRQTSDRPDPDQTQTSDRVRRDELSDEEPLRG